VAIKTSMNSGYSLEPTKANQGKHIKPMTHRRLTGTVGKVTRQGVTRTGHNEDASDGYSRLAELSALKTHGMLGILTDITISMVLLLLLEIIRYSL
jgi:hypothetical protein